MCGIAGEFRFDREGRVDRQRLQRMCDAIVHRGPDDEGTFVAGPVGIGMRRLSIIDPAGGHQPMHLHDGRLSIVFNGEIYNHLDVRRDLHARGHQFRTTSDTETILHAYDAYGVDCLRHLNGMFAIAIWDAVRQRLFVARDRLGIKPLYVHQSTAGVAFASEIKALLVDDAVPRELDHDAFKYFLRYGYVASPATLLRAVRQLPPAHYLFADASGVSRHRYWSLDGIRPSEQSEAEQADLVYETLKQAVRRQLISDVPLGAFLSGGLDSTSIVHLMSDVTGASVSTYSIGFAGGDTFHNELDDARFVSEWCHTSHHEIIVQPDAASLIPRLVHHLDQPLADSSFVVTYLVSALARETVKVIISGVGGDELFGGYRRYLGPRLGEYYDILPGAVQGAIASVARQVPVDRGSLVKNYFRLGRSFIDAHGLPAYDRYDRAVQMLSDEDVQQLSPMLTPGDSDLFDLRRAYFADAPDGDPLEQMLRLDLNTSLVDSLLLLTDKMSMATSLEARVPFLDHELVEAAARIPSAMKIKGTRLRHIQKKSLEGRVPARVLKKKKRGFGCPVGAWFRSDLRPLLRDTLSAAAIRRHGLLSPAKLEQIIDEHEQRRADHTDLLLALLTFELWHDEWIAG
jgi:asparagine synthase (glutamine-hydrolysing)